MLSALTGREVQKLLFNQRRREKTLPQTAVPTPKGPSWSGTHAAELLWPQVAPSHLLWDILTEEGLTVSKTQAATESRGTPVISESTPFRRLLL